MKDINGEKIFCLEYDKETLKDMVIEKQEEIERLNNIIKQKDEGIKALSEELCDTTKAIEEATEYVKSKKAIINTDYIRIFDLFKIDEQGYTDELLKILQGQ